MQNILRRALRGAALGFAGIASISSWAERPASAGAQTSSGTPPTSPPSSTSPAAAATTTMRSEENIHGRPGWVIENGRMRVALLRGGGHIAEVRLLSDDPQLAINPMFVPAGGTGYVGHLVCFPHFGPASPEERANGLRGHGEAGTVEWQQTKPPRIDASGLTFYYGAELPTTHFRIERAVSLRAGETVVRVEEWVENLAVYDRPYNWDQHATFGAPFVAPGKNLLDLSGGKGVTDPARTAKGQWAVGREFEWPNAPATDGGGTVSLREFRAVPGGQAYTPVLTQTSGERPAWFTLVNTEYPLLVGYLFSATDQPWIIDWQNQPRAESPAGTARGIEFGTSPWDEGLRKSVTRATLLGAPTYRWIASRQRLSTTFTIVLAEVPRGFAGVQNVQIRDDGRIAFTERGSTRVVTVAAAPQQAAPQQAAPQQPAPR